MGCQGLELGAEEKRIVHPSVIERFFADTIAAKIKSLLGTVPYCDSEHAVQPWQRRLDSPGVECVQHDLGVRGAAKRDMVFAYQFCTQLGIVIDLAVKNNEEAAAGRLHRLMARRRDINDGQTSKPERNSAGKVSPVAFIIRTAMRQRSRHAS